MDIDKIGMDFSELGNQPKSIFNRFLDTKSD